MTRPTGLTAIRRWLSELMTRPTGETEKERDLPTDLARTTVERSMKGTACLDPWSIATPGGSSARGTDDLQHGAIGTAEMTPRDSLPDLPNGTML